MAPTSSAPATLPTLHIQQHRPGCPAARLEAYLAARPNGEQLGIVRCMDCAAYDVTTPAVVADYQAAVQAADEKERTNGDQERA